VLLYKADEAKKKQQSSNPLLLADGIIVASVS